MIKRTTHESVFSICQGSATQIIASCYVNLDIMAHEGISLYWVHSYLSSIIGVCIRTPTIVYQELTGLPKTVESNS